MKQLILIPVPVNTIGLMLRDGFIRDDKFISYKAYGYKDVHSRFIKISAYKTANIIRKMFFKILITLSVLEQKK